MDSIENFRQLADYCRQNPEHEKLIIELVLRLSMSDFPKAESEENFVRHLYRLDETIDMDAEALRFIAVVLYPPYEAGQLVNLNDALQSDGDIIEVLEKWSNSDYTIAKEENFCTQLSEQENATGEEFIVARSVQSEPKSQPLTAAEKNTWAAKTHNYLQHREYYWPQMEAAGRWAAYNVGQGYVWLRGRKFFWPQIKSGILWTHGKIKDGIHWVKYEQEHYVWLRRYQGKQKGYHALKRCKAPRVKFTASHRKYFKKVYQSRPQDVFRMIKGLLTRSEMTKEQRDPVKRLREMISMREKILLQAETTLDAVNYGEVRFERMLKRLSRLTKNGKLNKKIKEYYLWMIEGPINEVPKTFRKGLDQCQTYPELKTFLRKYPLFRRTMLDRYKSLRLINAVKKIVAEFEECPDLTPIVNRYLGPQGEANVRRRLSQILVNSHIHEQIWRALAEEKKLEGVLRRLRKIPKKSDCRRLADALHNIITTFVDGGTPFTFTEFKAALNFVPKKLQAKVSELVRRQLQGQLKKQCENLVKSGGPPLNRLQNLCICLADNRYQGAPVKIFGYSPYELEDRINSLDNPDIAKVRHLLSSDKVPEGLVQLVVEGKKAQKAAGARTLANCLKTLKSMEQSVAERRRINLRTELVNLFKQYGAVNFSENSEQITGYQIARDINKFYADPERTTITITDHVNKQVKSIAKNLIDEERRKQLEKMEE